MQQTFLKKATSGEILIYHTLKKESYNIIKYGTIKDINNLNKVNYISYNSARNIDTIANRLLNSGYKLAYKIPNDTNHLIIKLDQITKSISKLKTIPTDINGYGLVMLATPIYNIKTFEDVYIGQPKYNGLRFHTQFISNPNDNKPTNLFSSIDNDNNEEVKLVTRRGNFYINEEIQNEFKKLYKFLINNGIISKDDNISFDGEIYHHGFNLEDIRKGVGLSKQNSTIRSEAINSNLVYAVVYDLIDNKLNNLYNMSTQLARLNMLSLIINSFYEKRTNEELNSDIINNKGPIIKLSPYKILSTSNDLKEVYDYFNKVLKDNYEGVILRPINNPYTYNKRTMIKVKPVYDGEFKILDIIYKSNKGNRFNITFVLENNINSLTFECTPGDREFSWNNNKKEEVYNNRSAYIGKYAFCKYYGRTNKQLPIHGNVVKIIDYESD